jgi:hypothetical protein
MKDFEPLGFSTLMVKLNYGMKAYVCMNKLILNETKELIAIAMATSFSIYNFPPPL